MKSQCHSAARIAPILPYEYSADIEINRGCVFGLNSLYTSFGIYKFHKKQSCRRV